MAYSTNGGRSHRWLCGSCVYKLEHPERPVAPLAPAPRGVARKQKETLFDALGAADRIGVTKLTDRQQFAIRTLIEHPEGLTAEDLGRLAHERFGNHRAGFTSCTYCHSAGLELLRALKARQLVSLRKGGVYQAVNAA